MTRSHATAGKTGLQLVSANGPGHFGPDHPLAAVAAQHCKAHGGRPWHGVGRVACGACWERAIRDDEQVRIEHDLPREIVADPDYVDEVAVDLACQGQVVTLTDVERVAAIRRMAGRGLACRTIARRVRVSSDRVAEVLRNPQTQWQADHKHLVTDPVTGATTRLPADPAHLVRQIRDHAAAGRSVTVLDDEAVRYGLLAARIAVRQRGRS